MANLVTAFNQGNLTNTQYYETAIQLRTVFGGLPAEEAMLQDILADFSTATDQLGMRLNLARTSEFVARRNELDDLRDRLFVGLLEAARNISRNDPDPQWKEAAASIVALIDKREDGFYKLSNAENTAELRLLLADLDQPNAQDALTLIGLQRVYTPLKQANADFEANEEAARQTPQDDADLPLLHTIKRNLARKGRLLLEIIEHFVEKDAAPYVGLMEQCYTAISEVRAVAKGRETREESEADTGTDTTPAE